MDNIETLALTSKFFVTHYSKRFIECGICHTPEARYLKMTRDIPRVCQFIPLQVFNFLLTQVSIIVLRNVFSAS